MGQKTSPNLLRLGINQTWKSDWSQINRSSGSLNEYSQSLHQDFLIRDYLDTLYLNLCRYSIVKKNKTNYSLWNQENFNFLKFCFKEDRSKVNSLKIYRSLVRDYNFYENKLNMKLIVCYLKYVYESRFRIKMINKLIKSLIQYSQKQKFDSSNFNYSSNNNLLLNRISHSLKKTYWIKYTSDINYLRYKKNNYYLKNKGIFLYELIKSNSSYSNFLSFKVLLLNICKHSGYLLNKFDFSKNSSRWKLYSNFYWRVIIKSLSNSFYLRKDRLVNNQNLLTNSFDFSLFYSLKNGIKFSEINKLESKFYSSASLGFKESDIFSYSSLSLFPQKGFKKLSSDFSKKLKIKNKFPLFLQWKNKKLDFPYVYRLSNYKLINSLEFSKSRVCNLSLKSSFLFDLINLYQKVRLNQFLFKLYKKNYWKDSNSQNLWFYRKHYNNLFISSLKKNSQNLPFKCNTFLKEHINRSFEWQSNILSGNSSYYISLQNPQWKSSLYDPYKVNSSLKLFEFLTKKAGDDLSSFFSNTKKKSFSKDILFDQSFKNLNDFSKYFVYFSKKKLYNNIDFQKYLTKNIKVLNLNYYYWKRSRLKRKKIGSLLLKKKFKRFGILKRQKKFKPNLSYLLFRDRRYKYPIKLLSQPRKRQLFSLSSYIMKEKRSNFYYFTNKRILSSRLADVRVKTRSSKNIIDIQLQLESQKYNQNLNFHIDQNALRKVRSKYNNVRYLKKMSFLKRKFGKKLRSKKSKNITRKYYSSLRSEQKYLLNSSLYKIFHLKRKGSYSYSRRFSSFLIWYKNLNKALYRRDACYSSSLPMVISSSYPLTKNSKLFSMKPLWIQGDTLPFTSKTQEKDINIISFMINYPKSKIFVKAAKLNQAFNFNPPVRTSLFLKSWNKKYRQKDGLGIFLKKPQQGISKKKKIKSIFSKIKVRSKHLVDLDRFQHFNAFKSFFSKFHSNSIVKGSRLELNIKHYDSRGHNAYTLVENISRFLIAYSKRGKGGRNKFNQMRNLSYRILKSIRQSNKKHYKGLGFAFSGRAYGAKKAANFKVSAGRLSLSSYNQPVDYSSIYKCTKNGTWGFQAWLNVSKYKRRALKCSPSLNIIQSKGIQKNKSNLKFDKKYNKKIWKNRLNMNQFI